MGIILTGFGKDGAQGLLDMRRARAHTIVQRAESCASSSMPTEAKKTGGARMELAPHKITACMVLFSEQP